MTKNKTDKKENLCARGASLWDAKEKLQTNNQNIYGIIKVLEENIGRKISDIPHSNIFTDMSLKQGR